MIAAVGIGCGDDLPSAVTDSDTGAVGSTGSSSGSAPSTSGADADTSTSASTGLDTGSDSGSEDSGESGDDGEPAWDWNIPDQLPPPVVPEDNPMTAEKVELGRHLFYDTRLSYNETQSCATCHLQELAFADGEVTPTGSEGAVLVRNSPGLANIAYLRPLTWANPLLPNLEE